MHEVLLTLVTLDGNLEDWVLNLRLSVDVVLKSTNHVIFSEFVLAIVLRYLAGSQWPCNAHARIIFFVPARAQLNHRLAAAVSKEVEQIVELVVEEHVLVNLDVAKKVLHHDFARVFVQEVIR